MTEIKIKAFFGDWKEVSREQAQRFVRVLYSGMTACNHEKKVKLIEANHLQGISFDDLMK